METSAIDEARGDRKTKIFIAKIGDFEFDRFPLVGGKAATIFDRSGTVIDAQYRERLLRQPATHFTRTATDVDH